MGMTCSARPLHILHQTIWLIHVDHQPDVTIIQPGTKSGSANEEGLWPPPPSLHFCGRKIYDLSSIDEVVGKIGNNCIRQSPDSLRVAIDDVSRLVMHRRLQAKLPMERTRGQQKVIPRSSVIVASCYEACIGLSPRN